MKKHLIPNVILLLLLATCISAQSADKTLESINKRYAEISAKAKACETDDDQGEYGELVMNTLTINSRNHQWRAVGIYGLTYKFFYNGGDSEARPYPDKLVFVVNERRISARRVREEWLYSETGVLMLFIYKDESEESTGESRIYYSGGKVIRTVDGIKVAERFTALDLKYANGRAAEGRRLKDFFDRSISL